MPEPDRRTSLESDICVHIFTVSAGMVGVCLTVIGILQIVIPGRLALGFMGGVCGFITYVVSVR